MLNSQWPKIWKMLHTNDHINKRQCKANKEWLDEHQYFACGVDKTKKIGKFFWGEPLDDGTLGIQKNDIIMLIWQGRIELVTVISDVIEDESSPLDNGWVFRKYLLLRSSELPSSEQFSYGHGLIQDLSDELEEFETEVLTGRFDISLEKLRELWTQNLSERSDSIKRPLNQIFYGPPGTGKTYHTVTEAVKICDSDFYLTHKEDREELKKRYDQLVLEKRVRFVTFHQSYGYEEFIEGLKAETTEDGGISYEIKDGIFKEICSRAIASPEELHSFDEALEKLKNSCEEKSLPLKTSKGFDFKVTYRGGKTFRISPLSSEGSRKSRDYPASIEHLKNLHLTGKEEGIYNISYVRALLDYMQNELGLKPVPPRKENEVVPYVLIIDEINRGNISKIFGELITLIEPSKRAGEEEALSLTLPYSGQEFSVPSNVYLIGTMNTADRSLAMMDTALRRRFEFVEMMPNPALLEETEEGIDLHELLTMINQRIEILYDREHMLGHAFFISVKNISKLKLVFQNKIIPLLQEYFFEDWEKIRLVLGDNQREENHQFIREVPRNENLFGQGDCSEYGLEEKNYRIVPAKEGVWEDPEAYKAIYDLKKVTHRQKSSHEG